ncbi:PstS family phosphate ABC transporter substrate-binding protein [Petrachloros mirabilis]
MKATHTSTRSMGFIVAVMCLAIAVLAISQPIRSHAESMASGNATHYQASNGLSGKVTIAGSDTMRPLMMRLAAEFSRLHPDVRFTIEGGGSSAAIREFVMGLSQQRRADKARSGHGGGGRVSLIASSRPLHSGEVKAFTAQHGHEPIGFPIAIDAVVLYVNPENPIEGLTLEQVAAIFAEESSKGKAKIRTWGELGLRGEWEHRKIRLYGRDKKSGTREFFEQHVLQGRAADSDILEQSGSATQILAIARDHNAIGYAGAGFQTNLVRLLGLAEEAGAPFVTPTTEMVQHGTYPLTRYLYLYVDKTPKAGLDPIIKELLTFANSSSGQAVVTKAGSYPLSAKQLARNAAFLRGDLATALADPNEDPRLAAMNGNGGSDMSEGETPKED